MNDWSKIDLDGAKDALKSLRQVTTAAGNYKSNPRNNKGFGSVMSN